MSFSNIPRLGFACKWSERNAKGEVVAVPEMNFKSTTLAWANRQPRAIAEQRLVDIFTHNVNAIDALVRQLATLPLNLRMARLGSDVCSLYTHEDYSEFWRDFINQPGLMQTRKLREIGDYARANDVRLSFHPGQFTVLASSNEGIVEKSIEEFEYHTDIARFMGYGQKFQDFKCNVHISGRRGPDGIRDVYNRLSPEARNILTLENEENAWGLEDVLSLSDIVPCVLDIHHHWIREGEYISAKDHRVKRVIDSWRGVRPVIHYSVSREDVLPGHSVTVAPDYKMLLESGHKKQQLRAHSDFYWNEATNRWALSFLETHDIMCESKAKNLASFELYEQWKK